MLVQHSANVIPTPRIVLRSPRWQAATIGKLLEAAIASKAGLFLYAIF